MKSSKFALLFFFSQLILISAWAQQLPSINITNYNNPSDGYIFIANFGSGTSGTYYLLILDKQGRTIYAKSFPYGMNGSLLDFKPQPNNKYSFFNGKQSQYYVLDNNFNVINIVKAKNGYSTNNHELFISSDNRHFIIADEVRTIDMSMLVAGGKSNAQVTGNIIQGIDSNNNIIFQWKVLDYIPITDHAGDLTAPAFDFAHTNSLFLDTDSTILMCNPGLNEITKIDLNNGNIIWRLGLNAKGNQFTFTDDTLGFIFQHYVTRLSNGNITLFDNGLGRYARAIEYEINEVNKTAKLVFQYRHNPDITGPSMGSVNRLENGNTFICWGSASKMSEVDTAGNNLFEASFPNCTYRALKYDIPNPIAHLISGPSEICEGQIVTYSALSTGSSTYSWNITNGTIISGQGTNEVIVKWLKDGQGIVKLTKTNSLNYKDYLLIYVTVKPSPEVNIGVVQNCKEVKFIDTSTNLVSRFWDFGDGDTSNLPDINHFYSLAGKYQVKLKVINSDGCTDSSLHTIIIPDSVTADFGIDSDVCVNENITIFNRSINTDSYFWDLGDSRTSIIKNPIAYNYTMPGTYHVRLIASGAGCKDSISKTVTVNPNPKADFSFIKQCKGARFKDSSENTINRIWDFGDGNTSKLTEISHIYAFSGSYQVKLKVLNEHECADSIIKTIIIPDSINADFNIDTIVCVDEIITIVNQSTNSDSYFWDLGDTRTSNHKNPLSFFYSKSGTYHLKLIASGSGCIDTLIKTVTVNPNPKAEFNFSLICKGARFINSSLNIISHNWDFGDGDTSILTVTDHLYGFPGTYHVKLKVSDNMGCSDSIIQNVVIPPSAKANFSFDSIVCENEMVTISNQSTDANRYFWDMGDSHISFLMTPEPFSYNLAGFYPVKLVASDSACSDSIIKTITVKPNPVINFVSTSLTDTTIHFIDSSIISSGSIVSWHWNFGDGQTSTIQHPVHVYSSTGTYPVELCVTSDEACIACGVKSIIIEENGINMSEKDYSISVFPNPNHGGFIVKSSKILDFIEISNAFGQEIMVVKPDSETNVIDLTNKPKGVYIVKLRFGEHDQLIRIISM